VNRRDDRRGPSAVPHTSVIEVAPRVAVESMKIVDEVAGSPGNELQTAPGGAGPESTDTRGQHSERTADARRRDPVA